MNGALQISLKKKFILNFKFDFSENFCYNSYKE